MLILNDKTSIFVDSRNRVDPDVARLVRANKGFGPVVIRFEEPSPRSERAFDYDHGHMGSPKHIEHLHSTAGQDDYCGGVSKEGHK